MVIEMAIMATISLYIVVIFISNILFQQFCRTLFLCSSFCLGNITGFAFINLSRLASIFSKVFLSCSRTLALIITIRTSVRLRCPSSFKQSPISDLAEDSFPSLVWREFPSLRYILCQNWRSFFSFVANWQESVVSSDCCTVSGFESLHSFLFILLIVCFLAILSVYLR